MKKRSLIVLRHLKMGPLIRKTKQETSNVKMVIINLVIYAFQESTVGLRVYFKFLTVYCYRYRYIKKCRKLVSLLINILLKKWQLVSPRPGTCFHQITQLANVSGKTR